MFSLKATRKRIPPSPSCSAGMPSKRAVSAAEPVSTTGPATVAVGVLVSLRRFSPFVQIAPETPHSRPAGSVTVTSPPPSGSTVISNRSRRSSTRRPRVTRPPVTVNASSRKLRKLIPMFSLKATRKVNALSPSCPSGMPSNAAVTAAGPGSGPSTVVEIPSDSDRPSAVQIAPGSPHGRPASSDIVRSPSASGSISNSHTTSRSCDPAFPPPTARVFERVPAPPGAWPATGRTDVTSPPSTSSPCSPTFSGVSSTASLNATRTFTRFVPSCRSGSDTNHARSALVPADADSMLASRLRRPFRGTTTLTAPASACVTV